MSKPREFLEKLTDHVKTGLEAAGFSTSYQSHENWPAAFYVWSSTSQGGVTLFFGGVCEHCGETLPYRVANSRSAHGARVAIPRDCDPASAADCLLREVLPMLTNRPPATAQLDRGVGAGLLSPQEARKVSDALKAGSH